MRTCPDSAKCAQDLSQGNRSLEIISEEPLTEYSLVVVDLRPLQSVVVGSSSFVFNVEHWVRFPIKDEIHHQSAHSSISIAEWVNGNELQVNQCGELTGCILSRLLLYQPKNSLSRGCSSTGDCGVNLLPVILTPWFLIFPAMSGFVPSKSLACQVQHHRQRQILLVSEHIEEDSLVGFGFLDVLEWFSARADSFFK